LLRVLAAVLAFTALAVLGVTGLLLLVKVLVATLLLKLCLIYHQGTTL
tara:strand:- start:614 stop:757 length:144 start_codon:yes stop_codon:yes gene_type:complete